MANAESQTTTLRSHHPQRNGGKALGRDGAQKVCVDRVIVHLQTHSGFRNEDKGDNTGLLHNESPLLSLMAAVRKLFSAVSTSGLEDTPVMFTVIDRT